MFGVYTVFYTGRVLRLPKIERVCIEHFMFALQGALCLFLTVAEIVPARRSSNDTC